jgi:zinc/manganese transport system permease protein
VTDWWTHIFDFTDYGDLLYLARGSIIAAVALGIIGGLIGPFVLMRDLPFAVHGVSELSFAGAAAALLVGADVVLGSLAGSIIAALLIGVLGARARERNSIIAVLMPAGLGLGILFLALYDGRGANKFGLLTGQIVAVAQPQLVSLLTVSAIVVVGLVLIWRPLTFASVDADVASARGVPTTALSIGFMVLLALATAVSIQIVGALLVLSLLVTPAAAAMRVTASPLLTTLLSVAFALTASVGGILLALGGGLPISPYVTTISFLIYVVCRIIGQRNRRRA